MIQIVFRYTLEDARRLFMAAGLCVEFKEVEIEFDNASNISTLPVWVVINPFTQKAELLETAFRRCLENDFKIKLPDDKLSIINSFKPHNL